jgi:DNA-binding CsgD family transcriptional regulator
MMFAQTSEVDSFTSTEEQKSSQQDQLDNVLLQGIIENFIDGILILTDRGELVQANNLACQICNRLVQGKPQPNLVPQEIWRVCQALIEICGSYCDRSVIMESEITTEPSTTLRIRARWLALDVRSHPCLLVILEDRYHSIQNLAIAEVDRYGLSPREAEVWLLRRANYYLKDIATELHISLNTVKKHLKNIHAKREKLLCMEK